MKAFPMEILCHEWFEKQQYAGYFCNNVPGTRFYPPVLCIYHIFTHISNGNLFIRSIWRKRTILRLFGQPFLPVNSFVLNLFSVIRKVYARFVSISSFFDLFYIGLDCHWQLVIHFPTLFVDVFMCSFASEQLSLDDYDFILRQMNAPADFHKLMCWWSEKIHLANGSCVLSSSGMRYVNWISK